MRPQPIVVLGMTGGAALFPAGDFQICGASAITPECQKIVLHKAARFDSTCLIVIPLCSRSRAE
jgi:hypothetical protein